MRALVTGAGSGIGAWAARRLADDGFDITVADLDPSSIADELGAAAIRLDVREETQVASVVERVDLLVNAASIVSDSWSESLDVNARGAFLCCKHAIPAMASRGGGAIVNVLALPQRGRIAHAASQGALAAMTRALAIDHGPDNVRINAVCAGDAPDEDVADAIVYLATAEFVTGTILTVDGGRNAAAFPSL
ncbi:MAG TPA: SDR family oxidoreductase [Gaiellaceae bacterium]